MHYSSWTDLNVSHVAKGSQSVHLNILAVTLLYRKDSQCLIGGGMCKGEEQVHGC